MYEDISGVPITRPAMAINSNQRRHQDVLNQIWSLIRVLCLFFWLNKLLLVCLQIGDWQWTFCNWSPTLIPCYLANTFILNFLCVMRCICDAPRLWLFLQECWVIHVLLVVMLHNHRCMHVYYTLCTTRSANTAESSMYFLWQYCRIIDVLAAQILQDHWCTRSAKNAKSPMYLQYKYCRITNVPIESANWSSCFWV